MIYMAYHSSLKEKKRNEEKSTKSSKCWSADIFFWLCINVSHSIIQIIHLETNKNNSLINIKEEYKCLVQNINI